MTSNVGKISLEEFRRRAARASIDEAFGFGWKIEEMKQQVIDDALVLAPFMNAKEIGKFISDLGSRMMHEMARAKR